MDPNTVVGALGMLLILAGFALEEFTSHSRHESVLYNILNAVGATLLIAYAYTLDSWPFLVLNAAWLLVALAKLLQIATGHTKASLS